MQVSQVNATVFSQAEDTAVPFELYITFACTIFPVSHQVNIEVIFFNKKSSVQYMNSFQLSIPQTVPNLYNHQ